MGIGEMPLLEPVSRSVSASISRRTSSKSTNLRPLQCRNSAYSAGREGRASAEQTGRAFQPTQVCNVPALLLTSWRMRGRRVTMPDPLGKKSLEDAQSLTRTTSLKQHIRLKVATIDTFLLVIHFSASSNTDEPVCIIDRRIDFQTCLL